MGLLTSNVLTVLQKEKGVSLQEAADLAGAHFKVLVGRFEDARGRLPSYGKEVDETAS